MGEELKTAVRPLCVLAGCTLETHTHTHTHTLRPMFKLKHERVHTDAAVNLHNHTKVEFVLPPAV